MWNLEKWCRWTYLQGRNRDADVENRPMDMCGDGINWEIGIDVYTLPCVNQLVGSSCISQGAQLGALWWPTGVDGGGVRGRSNRERVCVHIELSHFVVQQKLAQHCKQLYFKKYINPEYSLEGLMQKLKLQYFDHLVQGADSQGCWRKIEGKRRRGQQRTRWLDGITDSMDMNLRQLQKIVKDRGAWHVAAHGVKELDTT